MGRIINETPVTSLVDADVLMIDNPTLGSRKIAHSDLKAQYEIVARKNQANGYAGVGADGLLEPTIMRPALVPEEVANAAALAALTVVAGDIGKRLVRLQDTGVNYLAKATGTGADKWQVYNSNPSATKSAQGISELADDSEAFGATDDVRAMTPKMTRVATATIANSRAFMQGAVLDGSTGIVVSPAAFGALGYTVAITFNANSLSAVQELVDGANGLLIELQVNGSVMIYDRQAAAVIYTSATGLIVAGKTYQLVYARGALYLNGLLVASGLADNSTYTGSITRVGSSYSVGQIFAGYIYVSIFNRTLSATEVAALYESGPAASDYCNAGTQIITGSNSTFASDTGFWNKGAGSTISGGTGNIANGSYLARGSAMTIGLKYRAAFTVVSGQLQIDDGVTSKGGTKSAGTHTVEFTAAGVNLGISSVGGAAVVDDVTLTPIGLILAPDTRAPGNGYQWKDQSGNKADITLPTSGVRWALPDNRSNSVRGTLTWAGTHEAKSLLSQRALPDGAVITLITSKATAASSGSGKTIGTTNNATRWSLAATYNTAKKVDAPVFQLPAGTADADNDILVDPDTANYTGSIEVEAHYVITQST